MNPQVIDRLKCTQQEKAQLKTLLFKPSNEGGDPAKGLMLLAKVAPEYASKPRPAPSAADVARFLVRTGMQTARRVAARAGDAQDRKDLDAAAELVQAALKHDAPDFGKLAKAVKGSGAGAATLRHFCELATGKPAK